MKVLVLGATGRTGRLVVAELLERNITVRAFVRNTSHANFSKKVEIIEGDATNETAIRSAIISCDVVISTLGKSKKSDPLLQTKATRAVVAGIEKGGAQTKFISLTGTGVRLPGDTPSILDQLTNWFLVKLDKQKVMDGRQHFAVMQSSQIDWTLLRVLKLTNAKKVQLYSLTPSGPAKLLISRRTVAKILVDIAESDEYYQQAPVVSPGAENSA